LQSSLSCLFNFIVILCVWRSPFKVPLNLIQQGQQGILENLKKKMLFRSQHKKEVSLSRSASSSDAISVRGNGCYIGKYKVARQ
jgi:hypothetical protein